MLRKKVTERPKQVKLEKTSNQIPGPKPIFISKSMHSQTANL